MVGWGGGERGRNVMGGGGTGAKKCEKGRRWGTGGVIWAKRKAGPSLTPHARHDPIET